MTSVTPASYWRRSQTWQKLLGKHGVVVASTVIQVAPTELQAAVPYSLVIVEIAGERHTLMGAGNQTFNPNDQVHCVLRRQATPTAAGVIPYTIKVSHL